MRTYLTEQIFKIYETNPSRVKEPLEGFLLGFYWVFLNSIKSVTLNLEKNQIDCCENKN